ncbi:pilus assembly PilX family protein [Pseudomonas citronellolis]|uniref:pilus assembly PilX family protein n=1 Tax=Pseudomonas citronellolis TaxID=53408 RepID=UPI0023E35F68|nr:pilus assembly PilX N-terminal domain-containing protein [Pseudomonas citronellolis]MDF3931084.1 pilus assembly PilX N-terminal domain-containing protein [Pseudomonas citronellolis]
MNIRTTQNGVALLICLVLLLLLTVVAITAATQSSLQERMAANSQQQNVAFQAAESGIQGWIAKYQTNPQIAPLSTGEVKLKDTVPYTASAAQPTGCYGVVASYSLNAAEGSNSFQYACFDIQSTGKSCADSSCKDTDNPARAKHTQGHLVRY